MRLLGWSWSVNANLMSDRPSFSPINRVPLQIACSFRMCGSYGG
ncbi:hypothetical protein TSMEX_003711 [Taenia solium]|eukprot:TsM_000117000 transcript=TsM_000117000 gene=TsM_000117000